MKSIELIFCHRKTWNPLSWAIRKIQRFPSSHCAIHWHAESLNREMFYDASIWGVGFKNATEFYRDYIVDDRVLFNVDDPTRLITFCIDNLHLGYSYRLLIYHLFLNLGWKFERLAIGSTPICTTLSGLALVSVGIQLPAAPIDLYLVKLHRLALEYKKGAEK